MNVTSATTTGDYFFHLGQTAISTAFRGRIFVKKDASNNLAFGIAQSTATANYTAFSYALNTTYLVVLKYSIISDVTNDVASIYVNPILNTVEPSTGWIANTDAASTDFTEVGSVALRQGGASSDPALILAGIRISNTWSDIVGAVPVFTGTGDWSETARWSTGSVPSSSSDAIINGSASISSTISVGKLTINNSCSLTLTNTGSLTVSGTLTNSAGTSGLVINPGGQLKNNTAGVDATVNLDVTGGALWHLFCLPTTTGITASPFFDLAYIDEYVEGSAAWNRLGNASTVAPNIGYSINFELTTPLSFTGTLNNNAGQSLSGLSFSEINGNPDYEGWHLLGNTFTCGIDAAQISATGDVNGSAYVWDEGGSGNYLPYSINGGGAPNGTIAPMQGFFVKVTTSTNTLNIPTSSKTIGGSFLKSISNSEMLTLSIAGNNYSDKTYVKFNPEATANFDQAFDAYKRAGLDAAPQLYSILPNEKAAVNTLPDYTTNSNVALGLKVGASTSYTINVSGIESFDASLPVRLDDLKLGTSQDMRINPVYTFDAAPGDDENRFLLSFASVTAVNELNASGIRVVSDNGIIRVTHSLPATGTVYLYSVSGQLLATSTLNKGETTLRAASAGVYLVRVVTGKTSLTRKMVVVQ